MKVESAAVDSSSDIDELKELVGDTIDVGTEPSLVGSVEAAC